jgi:cytidyltransferase-like protein
MKVVIATGGFDPLHSGHIFYFKAAKELGDILVVGLNSDAWLARKKGKAFMPFNERKTIVENIKCVGNAFAFDDADGSAINAIKHVKEIFPRNSEIIFANGGDRTEANIPEMVFDDVKFVFGVGGYNKENSSSWILNSWLKPVTYRKWGKYTILDENTGWKVKELSFDPDKELSDQRHFKRSEHWHIVKGNIQMNLEYPDGKKETVILNSGDSIDIPFNTWHKAFNISDNSSKIIEVALGEDITEDDIERRD